MTMGLTNVIQQSSFVLVLLLVQISTRYSRASFTVIRDQQDRFEIPNIPLLPLRSSCGAHYCTCNPEYGTFVWSNNGGQLNGDCLSDQKLIKRDRQACTGFYQFHNGDLMRLLNMEVNSDRNNMTVNVPVNESMTCKLNWGNSLYSYDGSNWFNFTNHDPQFDQIIDGTSDSGMKTSFFQLTNVSTFFQKWNSTLLKLKVECHNPNNIMQQEDGCVLFKVNGTFEQEYILTTLPTNSTNISAILTTPFTPKSSPTSHQNIGTKTTNCVTCGKTEEQSDSMSSQTTIIIVVVVVAVVVAVAIVTIILCRRRKRPKDPAAETAGHLGDIVIYEDPDAVVSSQRVQENESVGGQYMNTSGEGEYCSIGEPPHIYNQPGEQVGHTPTNDQVNASSSEPFYNTIEENEHSEEQQLNEHQPSQSKSEEKTSDEPYYFVLDKNERLPKTASLNI